MSLITNDQVSDIPMTDLKEQPKQQKKVSMNDFISTHDKAQIYVQALEEAKKEEQVITISNKRPLVMESSGTSSESEEEDSSVEAAKRANNFDVKTGIS
jgi:hypothetical protein